jgi:hypothetical protein
MGRINVCARCGVHRKDKSREFFGLWFVDFTNRAGWSPGCAGARALRESRRDGLTCVFIPLAAVWSSGR